MFLVMRTDASRAAVEAIRNWVKEAGLDAEVFEGVGRTVVGVEGETSSEFEALLENMPGVQQVVGRKLGEPSTHDLRVAGIRPLVSPAILLDELPLSEVGSTTVSRAGGNRPHPRRTRRSSDRGGRSLFRPRSVRRARLRATP